MVPHRGVLRYGSEASSAPNKALEPTASSVRSYLPPASGGGSPPALGGFRSLRSSVRSADVDPHMQAGSRQHVDKGVDAEQLDLPAYEVTNPWLGDPKHLGRRGLR